MSRLTICFLLLIILLLPGLAAAQSSDNLCYTAFNRACYDDIEWEIGYFWAHNAPSKASCAKYHWTFGDRIGDIWGMCNEYGMPDPNSPTSGSPPDNGANGVNGVNGASGTDDSDADLVFKLTSRWHAITQDQEYLCPVEGLDPIIDYENNTFVCATGF